MDVELLRRLDRASLRPLRGVGLHGTHQVKVTLVKVMSITGLSVRCNEYNNAWRPQEVMVPERQPPTAP